VQLLQLEPNPSFLELYSRIPVLYAMHCNSEFISWHRIDPQPGRLRRSGEQSTGGRNPVYLAIDPTNQSLVIATYRALLVRIMPWMFALHLRWTVGRL
jgi:6-phosphogluconolactonase